MMNLKNTHNLLATASAHHAERGGTSHRGFTLVEALIAVSILLVIILFTSKIFSSVSEVTSNGQGNADIFQEVAAFETQLRQDFDRLSYDGFFVIWCRAIRNDVNDPTRAGVTPGTNPRFWLDPNRDATEYIRSDRLLFFTQGENTVQIFRGSQGDNRKAQTTAARVYYGHGYQLGDLVAAGDNLDPADPINVDFPPWDIGNNGMINTEVNGPVNGFSQPSANQWTFARQNILLGDDGGSTTSYLSQGQSTDSIWDWNIHTSRVDVAASQMNDIEAVLTNPADDWALQRAEMLRAMFYPNAERQARSMFRQDHSATIGSLGSAVSDVIIDWTYDINNGSLGPAFRGINIPSYGEKPWFGLPDYELPVGQERGVLMLGDGSAGFGSPWYIDNGLPIDAGLIESLDRDYFGNYATDEIDISYIATFGYNQSQPFKVFNPPDGSAGEIPYTPWPDAIRITLRVHDPRGELEEGRLVQFVLGLPERTGDYNATFR